MTLLRRPTSRQEDILRALAADPEATLEQIARNLGISIHTARGYVKEIALQIQNPHGLPALRLVRAFAIARAYREQYD